MDISPTPVILLALLVIPLTLLMLTLVGLENFGVAKPVDETTALLVREIATTIEMSLMHGVLLRN
jgi:hypothetical protein